MWSYKKLTALLAIIASIHSPGVMSQSFYAINYTVNNGLPSNNINACSKDANGTYWFATNGGLVKWGNNFETYSTHNGLPENQISCISTDNSNNLWVGTAGNGIACYDGTAFNLFDTTNGLPNNNVKSIFYSKTNNLLIVVLENWLSVYDGKVFRNTKLSSDQIGITNFLEHESTIFFKTLSSNYYKYIPIENQIEEVNEQEFNSLEYNNHKATNSSFQPVGSLTVQKDSIAKGLDIDVSLISFIAYEPHDKSYLIGTQGKGLFVLPSIAFKYYKSILPHKDLHYLTLQNGSGNSITLLGDYVAAIDISGSHNQITGESLKCRKKDQQVQQIAIKKNKIVYRSGNGLYYYNKRTNNETKLASDSCCYFYCNDTIILSQYHNTIDVHHFPQLDLIKTLPMPFLINQVIDFNESLFISTQNNGLFQLNLKTKELTHLNKTFSFIPENINKILIDKRQNLIIIDNNESIHFISIKNQTLKLIDKWNPSDLNNTSSIQWALIDKKNNLWMASLNYLHQIILADYYEHSKKTIKTWGAGEGYFAPNSIGAIETDKGLICILDPENLITFNPADLAAIDRNPLVVLSKISFRNGSIISQHPYSTLKNHEKSKLNSLGLRFQYHENSITFDFESVNTLSKDQLIYRSKLTPDMQGWSAFSKTSTVNLSNLKPGNYNLKVQACFAHFPNRIQTLEYIFSISPPWYKNIYAYMIYAIIIILLMAFILNIRIKKIRSDDELNIQSRERMAMLKMEALQSQMNPHFIFNAMNSLQYSILENNTDKSLEFIGEFSKLIRSTLENASQQFISVKDEIEYIENYLRVEQMRYYKNFQYSINISDDIDQAKYKVPPMLIQPHIENAIKYSISSNVCYIIISISKVHDKLICMIEDNGIGRSHSSKLKKNHQSKGQSITKERFEILNSYYNKNNEYRFDIEDLFDNENNPSGTRITLFFPIVFDKISS